jgi:hypothetical protein
MLKLASLITKPRYLHRKQIKVNYVTQFSTDLILKDKIEKNLNKKHKNKPKSTQVNMLSIIPEL